jgi:hypothetical protein
LMVKARAVDTIIAIDAVSSIHLVSRVRSLTTCRPGIVTTSLPVARSSPRRTAATSSPPRTPSQMSR